MAWLLESGGALRDALSRPAPLRRAEIRFRAKHHARPVRENGVKRLVKPAGRELLPCVAPGGVASTIPREKSQARLRSHPRPRPGSKMGVPPLGRLARFCQETEQKLKGRKRKQVELPPFPV